MTVRALNFLPICLLAWITLAGAITEKGVVFLDDYTFDKVVDGSRDVLVHFNKEYAYGEDYDAFKELAKAVGEGRHELLVAGVQVSKRDYDPKNVELGARFGAVDAKKFPLYLLFRKGVSAHGEALRYPEDAPKRATDLLAWLASHTGSFYGLKGQIRELDSLAKELVAAADDGEARRAVAARAQEAAAGFAGTDHADAAKYYAKVMSKAAEAPEYPASEAKRLNGLLSGQMSDEKRAAMQLKINVLASFLGGSRQEPPSDGAGEL